MTFRTATELAVALRARKVSARELAEQAIAAIEAEDKRLNAVPVRDFDRALKAAASADAALARNEPGALLGLPMTVKESFNIAGLPTTWGIPGTKEIPVTQDAVAAARLKSAGAVLLGKSNVSTMLSDWQSSNAVYGTSNNPWNPDRTPGGSSGGSAAALAAGLVPLELGSDIGGSLRIPAHFCGVYAHKPSLGVVPLRGHAPPGVPMLSVMPQFDLPVAGPMSRSAADLMLALDVLAGPDEADATAYRLQLPAPRHPVLRDYRVLVIANHPLVPTGSAVRQALEEMAAKLERAGCRVAYSSPLLPDFELMARTYVKLLMAFFGANMPDAEYSEMKARSAGIPEAASDMQSITLRSWAASHREWFQADGVRSFLAHQWRSLFREWDIVFCPVTPAPAFPHETRAWEERELIVDGRPVRYGDQFHWVGPATLCGLPVTALPAGLSPEGLPIGLQAIGPYLEDRTPIHFASLLERELGIGFVAPPAYADASGKIPA